MFHIGQKVRLTNDGISKRIPKMARANGTVVAGHIPNEDWVPIEWDVIKDPVTNKPTIWTEHKTNLLKV